MSESGFHKVVREGIERNIAQALAAGDSDLANAQLDIWPYGRPRLIEPDAQEPTTIEFDAVDDAA